MARSGSRCRRRVAPSRILTQAAQIKTVLFALPQFFKNHGYFTSAAGKLYHDGMDDPASWSFPSNQTAWLGCQCDQGDKCDQYSNYCEVTNASATPYTDEDLALHEGLARLDEAAASGKPWWVGIGVHRPHHSSRLPTGWTGPEIFPPGAADAVVPPRHPLAPVGAPYMSGNWFAGDYIDPAHGCPNCSVPAVRSVEYRRWCSAAIQISRQGAAPSDGSSIVAMPLQVLRGDELR